MVDVSGLNAKACMGDVVRFAGRSNLTQVASDLPLLQHCTMNLRRKTAKMGPVNLRHLQRY